MNRILCSLFFLCFTSALSAQTYTVGDRLIPSAKDFEALGASTKTKVFTYRYIKPITAILYERQVGDIIIGIKDGVIVTTRYNLIPEKIDVGVPKHLVKTIETALDIPFTLIQGVYGVNIDHMTFSISRENSIMTFRKDRIVLHASVKSSILSSN